MLAIVCLKPDVRSAADGEAPPAATFAPPQGAQTFDRVRDAVRACDGDVVLVRPRTRAVPGWEQGLARAAEVDDRVATVSALSLPVSADDFAESADRVRAAAQCLHPALPMPDGPCVLLRRGALELVGWPAGDDDGAALAAFAAACTVTGLLHVLADDTLVRDDDPARVLGEVGARDAAAAGPQPAPLARARRVARRAIGGLSVTIDARLLDEPLGGSQVYTLALIDALAKTRAATLRVLLGPRPGRDAQDALGELDLDLLSYDSAVAGVERSLVVHRPMQVFTPDDMALLRLVGERIVVTHHDGILFHNPAYFSDAALWRSYRRVTMQALAEADRVIFSTRHARDEAVRDELVTPQRSAVVRLGTDHALSIAEVAPPALAADARPFLLCLGSDLRHKNRLFAIRLARGLRELGWNGRLVLAGGRAEHGSSAHDEQQLLAGWPQADDVVVTLEHVSEAEREWLMKQCAAVVFTSVSEGFGLPPFEAARREVPCLYAPRSAMAELLPEEAASIVPWDVDASARRALVLLSEPAARARHLDLLRGAALRLTWQHCADELIDVYEAAARAPTRAVSGLVAQADERERDMVALNDLTIDLRAQLDALGADALALVGRDGLVPRDVQRALLAAAGRRPSRATLFALLRAGYRIGHRGR